jgi:hypothetical protein
MEARLNHLEHLAGLAREGFTLTIVHADDRSHGAPKPVRKLYTVTARRVVDDVTHLHRGRSESLAEAIERTAP